MPFVDDPAPDEHTGEEPGCFHDIEEEAPAAKKQRLEAAPAEDQTAYYVAARWSLSDEERFLFEFTLSSLLYPENLEGITRLFSTLDSNSDGVLTYEDFKEERFKSLGERLAALWNGIYQAFDFNDDGTVTEKEVVAGFVMLMLKKQQAPLAMASGVKQLVRWVREFNRQTTEAVKEESERYGLVTLSRTLTNDSAAADEAGPVLHRLTSVVSDELSRREKFVLRPLRSLLNPEQGQKRDALFNLLDQNQDGFLDAADFDHKVPLIQETLQKFWIELQQMCDEDKDAAVTPSEFESGIIWDTVRSQFVAAAAADGLSLLTKWGHEFSKRLDASLQKMDETLTRVAMPSRPTK